jgi:hypothetical protein
MRWIIAFVLLFAATVAFLVVGEFPELLNDYPKLRQINNELREMLGLEPTDSSYLSSRKLDEIDGILTEDAKESALRDACGDPPENPWTRPTPPTQADLDRYSLALEIWRYCARNHQKQALAPYTGQEGGKEASPAGGKLSTYEEQ